MSQCNIDFLARDGSYYYSNPDGSTYYNDGKGGSVYTPPSSGSVNSGGGNEDSYPSRDATDSTSCNDYKSNLDGTTYDNNEEGESMYTPSSSGSMNPTGGSEGQQHSSNSNYTTTSVSCPSASVYGFGGEIRK